jgi:site-specific recombinase XerD
MKRSRPSVDKILEAQIEVLVTTRRPKTVRCYRYCAHNFRLVDTLEVNALRLMRATGIRISECINLPLDCLLQISEKQVALRVPWANFIPNA